MDDYTPTVGQARDSYCDSEARHENHGSWISEEQHAEYHAQFDRMIAQVKADTIKDAAAVLHSSDRVWAHRAAIWLLGSYSEVRGTGTPTGEGK